MLDGTKTAADKEPVKWWLFTGCQDTSLLLYIGQNVTRGQAQGGVFDACIPFASKAMLGFSTSHLFKKTYITPDSTNRHFDVVHSIDVC